MVEIITNEKAAPKPKKSLVAKHQLVKPEIKAVLPDYVAGYITGLEDVVELFELQLEGISKAITGTLNIHDRRGLVLAKEQLLTCQQSVAVKAVSAANTAITLMSAQTQEGKA